MKRLLFWTILWTLCPLLLIAQAPDTLWTKPYDGYSVQQTTDGGYIIVGETDGWPINVNLIKTDSLGNSLWIKTYGGSGIDRGLAIQQTSDGGYIIAGGTESFSVDVADVWLLKTDANGDTIWTKTFSGGDESDEGCDVKQTIDGGYIITGISVLSNGTQRVYLVRTDSLGDTLWTKTYGGGNNHVGNSVQQTTDGGYIVTGCWGQDALLLKTDADGNLSWLRTYSGYGRGGNSVQQTSDSGYIVTGSKNHEIMLFKTNAQGDSIWAKSYGSGEGSSVQPTSDGGYFIAGYDGNMAYSWMVLFKTDANGDTLWTRCIGSRPKSMYAFSGQQTTDQGYIAVGHWLAKLEPDIGIEEQPVQKLIEEVFTATVFCGPLQLPKGKQCKVFDITGRVVIPQHIKPGIYFIEVGGKVVRKVVKIK